MKCDVCILISFAYTLKNNLVKKKTVNYWQLWLPASYCKNTVCYCFWNEQPNTVLYCIYSYML